ncbi:MAG: alpha/beta fold hydrolase [Acidimicrobiales bacterium]
MPTFATFDGLRLHYDVSGSGTPVVLLHSFPFDSRVWRTTGVLPALVATGRSAISLDRRGHGLSDKPHDPAAYADNAAARDVSCLLDHLSLPSGDLFAYSLGSHVGLRVLQDEPRIRRAVLGGVGAGVLTWDQEHAERVAELLEIGDPERLDERGRRMIERIARLQGDRFALAAQWRGRYVQYEPDFSMVTAPVLILTGERDDDGGDPSLLASQIPGARLERVDADHASTMDHPDFVKRALEFLNE